jgi:hypothetical protein
VLPRILDGHRDFGGRRAGARVIAGNGDDLIALEGDKCLAARVIDVGEPQQGSRGGRRTAEKNRK